MLPTESPVKTSASLDDIVKVHWTQSEGRLVSYFYTGEIEVCSNPEVLYDRFNICFSHMTYQPIIGFPLFTTKHEFFLFFLPAVSGFQALFHRHVKTVTL